MNFSYRHRIVARQPQLDRNGLTPVRDRFKKLCKSARSVRHRSRITFMSHPFQILAGFLDRHTDEVEGRSSEEPSAELRGQLQQFAAGTLPEPDRRRVVSLLKDHPHWLPLLAEEVKARRTDKS